LNTGYALWSARRTSNTCRSRVALNPGLALRPGNFADIEIFVESNESKPAILVEVIDIGIYDGLVNQRPLSGVDAKNRLGGSQV
jgi:hypothetical protein